MKSPLIVTLGISCTLLGLYILLVSLLTLEPTPDYHIGCYLSNHTTDNSFRFKTRLRQLKSTGEHSRDLHSKLKNSHLVDPQLHTKSVHLTTKVDEYIKKRTLVQKYQQSNMQFFAQLSNAKQTYQDCVNDLRSNIDIDDSRQLWTQYQNCFNRYEGLKQDVDRLYQKRNKYLHQIDSLLASDPNSNPNFDFEAELRKIKERYDRQNAQNDKNKQNYISELKRLQHKNQTKSSQYDENQRQYTRAQLQLDICLKNLKEFKKCEDIAKALKEYGYVEPVQSLEERIRSKRQILMQMRQLALESRQAGGNNEAITEMYIKRQKQLLQTMRLRLTMGYDEMKECGCSQETRKKLESDFQSIKIKLNLSKKDINDLIFQISTLQRKIKETDQLREKLIKEFTEETQRLRNRQTSNIVSLKQRLEILRASLSQVNSEINQYDRKLNSLEFECNQFKDRLSLRLKDSNMITECLKNKDYFEKLRVKAELILRTDDESSIELREQVRKGFWDITYPDTDVIKHMILVSHDMDRLEHIAEQPSSSYQEQSLQQPQTQRVLEKQVIRIQREINITTPESVERIHQKEEIIIKPVHAQNNDIPANSQNNDL